MARLLASTNGVPLKVAQREADPTKFLPYARHLNEDMVALDSGDMLAFCEELGDVLFSLVNYARFLGIDPDEALERTNRKFIRRFQFLERESHADGKVMGEMTLAEMDAYWERAKAQ